MAVVVRKQVSGGNLVQTKYSLAIQAAAQTYRQLILVNFYLGTRSM